MEQASKLLRYLYDPEPKNDSHDTIICLGCSYEDESSASLDSRQQRSINWPKPFLQDHDARFTFTYRTGFEKILRSSSDQSFAIKLGRDGFTADTGFGCMIRSAQTLLANALLTLQLGRDWRRGLRQDIEAQIISMFSDDVRAPFSIHRFIEHGANFCDKPPGQWFGPNAASLCIKHLSANWHDAPLVVYVAAEQGGTIYEESVLEIAMSTDAFQPVLILVPQRLGHDQINPVYTQSLLSLFEISQFMGIAGGRPSSAHYFFARQDHHLFFLDPHFPRASLPFHEDLSLYTQDDLDSVHTARVRRMPLQAMDPSMLIGFLIKDKIDWNSLKQAMRPTQGMTQVVTIEEGYTPTDRYDSDPESRTSDVFSDQEGLQ